MGAILPYLAANDRVFVYMLGLLSFEDFFSTTGVFGLWKADRRRPLPRAA